LSSSVTISVCPFAQQRFHRLHAQELLTEVYYGATFVNGVRVMKQEWRVAA